MASTTDTATERRKDVVVARKFLGFQCSRCTELTLCQSCVHSLVGCVLCDRMTPCHACSNCGQCVPCVGPDCCFCYEASRPGGALVSCYDCAVDAMGCPACHALGKCHACSQCGQCVECDGPECPLCDETSSMIPVCRSCMVGLIGCLECGTIDECRPCRDCFACVPRSEGKGARCYACQSWACEVCDAVMRPDEVSHEQQLRCAQCQNSRCPFCFHVSRLPHTPCVRCRSALTRQALHPSGPVVAYRALNWHDVHSLQIGRPFLTAKHEQSLHSADCHVLEGCYLHTSFISVTFSLACARYWCRMGTRKGHGPGRIARMLLYPHQLYRWHSHSSVVLFRLQRYQERLVHQRIPVEQVLDVSFYTD